MMEEWDLTSIQAGTVGSYSLYGMMKSALILAPIADKFGRKNVLVICMILFSVFTLGHGFYITSHVSSSCVSLRQLAWEP
ncbi:MFS transporter [Peribacillus simplex]|uniref:MFS transporter n=1 Tax=Peribacillus simplex TaxID=1478 RepID=UPI0024C18AE0|nr:MFS transporter [Peribacillus simplex]WHY99649.1 MFS transporter [Peribacillus simplex]